MKIIIFDDDPTGSQTVYGCPLLLNWDEQSLEKAFKQPSQLIFILANTRSLSSTLADKKIKEICASLKNFFLRKGYSKDDYFYISRGDSTLRGHGVLEPAILAEELGPFQATFHIPAFFEKKFFRDKHISLIFISAKAADKALVLASININ